MMNKIDDKCWTKILKKLTLKDQIILFQVCKYFRTLVYNHWQNKYKILQLDHSFGKEELSTNEILIFFANVCNAVEKARLHYVSKEIFGMLKAHKFPNTYDLDIGCRWSPGHEHNVVATLHKMFPNLRIFYPCGKFSGKYFVLWRKLERLVLSNCDYLDYKELSNIMATIHLKSIKLCNRNSEIFWSHWKQPLRGDVLRNCMLEEIVLNSYELGIFVSEKNFQNLRNLKTFQITDKYNYKNRENLTKLYMLLGKYKSTKVVSVQSRHTIKNILPIAIYKNFHTHLRKLTFISDDNAFIEISNYMENLPALRELEFCEVRITTASFFQLLTRCENIEVISIEKCAVYPRNYDVHIGDIAPRRTRQLVINTYGNLFELKMDDNLGPILLTNRNLVSYNESLLSIEFE